MSKSNLYISLFHGRKTPDEDLDDWGTEGPLIGPIGFTWTYGFMKVHDAAFEDHFTLPNENDLILFDGIYYGDFEIMEDTCDAFIASKEQGRKILSYEQANKIIK